MGGRTERVSLPYTHYPVQNRQQWEAAATRMKLNSMLCEDLDGWAEELREVQEGGEVCALIVDSYCCTGLPWWFRG